VHDLQLHRHRGGLLCVVSWEPLRPFEIPIIGFFKLTFGLY